SMLAFLRLLTNPRVFEHPEPIGDAWRQVHSWLACETAWIPQPTERHAELLGQFLALPGIYGNLIPVLISLRWPWNTDLRCALPMVILRGFAVCVGLIPSRPKHERVSPSDPWCTMSRGDARIIVLRATTILSTRSLT